MRRGWAGEAVCLDGAKCARDLKDKLAEQVKLLRAQGYTPGLGTLLVGEDPASCAYVNAKHRDCQEIGIVSIREELPAESSTEEVLAAITRLNTNPDCTGYIVQLPLPAQIDTQAVLLAIDPEKDADGLHPLNLGKLVLNIDGEIDFPLPCTPRACLDLLETYGISLAGKEVCVIGRGTTVGRSLPLLLTRKRINATVTWCHTGTKDLSTHTKKADVVVSAAGVKGLITADMLKPGAIVLDVGVSRGEPDPDTGKSQLHGDIADGVDKVAAFISPNPTGIGPMTRANLLLNVIEMATRKSSRTDQG